MDRQFLRDLAEADAADLIDEARAGARARAKALLEDALVDELLAAAARRAPQPEPEAGEAWWVYCVVRAEEAAELATGLTGVQDGTPVEVLAEGELAALLSRVPLAEYGDEALRRHLEDIAWLERTARAHESVQESVMRQAPLVPLRLCTIYRDQDGVRRVLRENADLFSQNLGSLQDCAEWGVKVFLEQQTCPAPVEPAGQTVSGSGYLASRQQERDQARQADELCAACAEEVHHTLAALSRAARANPAQSPEAHGRDAEMILNGAYLVEDLRVGELEGTVAGLHEKWSPHGLLIELTGPWPPYNFVSESAGMIS